LRSSLQRACNRLSNYLHRYLVLAKIL